MHFPIFVFSTSCTSRGRRRRRSCVPAKQAASRNEPSSIWFLFSGFVLFLRLGELSSVLKAMVDNINKMELEGSDDSRGSTAEAEIPAPQQKRGGGRKPVCPCSALPFLVALLMVTAICRGTQKTQSSGTGCFQKTSDRVHKTT